MAALPLSNVSLGWGFEGWRSSQARAGQRERPGGSGTLGVSLKVTKAKKEPYLNAGNWGWDPGAEQSEGTEWDQKGK